MIKDSMFLDTVKLVIKPPYHIASDQFPLLSSNAWDRHDTHGRSTYSIKPRIRKKLTNAGGSYEPSVVYRMTTIDGVRSYELILEFSVPKLLHQYNFRPASPAELDEINRKLLYSIQYTYAFYDVTPEMVEEAELSRMDCMTTVTYANAGTCQCALDRIGSAGLDKRLTVDIPAFFKQARGVNIHCKSWQFVFYDKHKELSSKRNRNGGLFYEHEGDLCYVDGLLESLRSSGGSMMQCELRLNTRANIRRALKIIGEEPKTLTLKEIVEKEIPLKILRHYWSIILAGLPRYDLQVISEREALTKLMSSGLTTKEISDNFLLARLNSVFPRQTLRDLCDTTHSRSWWYSFRKRTESIPVLSDAEDPVSYITNAIFPCVNEDTKCNPPCPSITNYMCFRIKTFMFLNTCRSSLHHAHTSARNTIMHRIMVDIRAPPILLAGEVARHQPP